MTKKIRLLLLLTCITISLSTTGNPAPSPPTAKEKISRELRSNFLKMLTDLAAQYDSEEVCCDGKCVLDGVATVFDIAAQQGIFFDTREIREIKATFLTIPTELAELRGSLEGQEKQATFDEALNKTNLLKRLTDLAAQYGSRRACKGRVLDGVTTILNTAAQQEIFFNDREINPIVLDNDDEDFPSFSPLLVAAAKGHSKLVEAFGKHHIKRLQIETRYFRETPEDIATREATRFFGVSKPHLDTLAALRQLREQKLEERLKTEKK